MRRYGWVPDLPDARDHVYAAPSHYMTLPPMVDLRSLCSAVEDQGELGSCTGNAIAGALEYLRNKQQLPFFDFSRLFIYYNERAMEHTIKSDAGAQIRDGIKSVAKLGCCHESLWPYNVAKFADKPDANCYADALKIQPIQYTRVLSLKDMLQQLASGFPVVFGFSVYESFESDAMAETGLMRMPNLHTERCLGGHAVLAVGYDKVKQLLLVRNSWGDKWGQGGYFWMPWHMITNKNLSDDFWTITQTVA